MIHFVLAVADGTLLNINATTLPQEVIMEHWPVLEGAERVFLPGELKGPIDHWRVVDGEVVERTVMAPSISTTSIAADGVAECVLSGLPNPCTVTIRGAVTAGPVALVGGTLTLTSTTPGAITVQVRADPTHTPWETTIHAA